MVRPHEDAVHWTGLHTQGTKHALRVVHSKPVDSKSLTNRILYFLDVNTVDRTCLSSLFATNTGRQIKPVKTTVTRLHLDGLLGISVRVGEGLSFLMVGFAHCDQCHNHPMSNSPDCLPDVSKPGNHVEFSWVCNRTKSLEFRSKSSDFNAWNYRSDRGARKHVNGPPSIEKLIPHDPAARSAVPGMLST